MMMDLVEVGLVRFEVAIATSDMQSMVVAEMGGIVKLMMGRR